MLADVVSIVGPSLPCDGVRTLKWVQRIRDRAVRYQDDELRHHPKAGAARLPKC